jgi:acetyl esterase/lipase
LLLEYSRLLVNILRTNFSIPQWLAHEQAVDLLSPKPVITDPIERQKLYSQRCKDLNAELLAGRDKHLTEDIEIHNTRVEVEPYPGSLSPNPHFIPIRSYNPWSNPSGPSPVEFNEEKPQPEGSPIVIYWHGGGLYVGDLDSEDLTCRRICKELQCTVYSCDYRLMPQHTADAALEDAVTAFMRITASRKASRLILMGSSSGGQLAAQVSQAFPNSKAVHECYKIQGVLLRSPVTCNATDDGEDLPERFKELHTSISPAFHTSLLSIPAVNSANRTGMELPLEAYDLSGMARHWIQVCTNDIYYSDGVCYAMLLKQGGVDVKLDVVEGWPHTFWLKAPSLERAVKAEKDMIEGLRWLLESEIEEGQEPNEEDEKE